MSVVARAADQSPTERGEYWRTALSQAFVPLAVTPGPDPLAGTPRTARLDGLQVAEVTGSSQTVYRDRALIRRADPEYYKIGLQLRGRGVVRQDGREAVLTPGEFTVYDTSRPYRLVNAEPFHRPRARRPARRPALTSPPSSTPAGSAAPREAGAVELGGC